MRVLLSLAVLGLAALLLGAAPRRPAGLIGLTAVGDCSAPVGNCRLTASWVPGANWNPATDSVRTIWAQTLPRALVLDTNYTRAAADTIQLARPVDGATKTGTVVGCVYRRGLASGYCATPARWSVTIPAPPPPDTLRDFMVTPASVTLVPTQRQFFAVSQ